MMSRNVGSFRDLGRQWWKFRYHQGMREPTETLQDFREKHKYTPQISEESPRRLLLKY